MVFLRLGLILVAGYVAIIGMLMANETFLVYPVSKYPNGNWKPKNFNFEEVAFESKDGTWLVGWYLKPLAGASSAVPSEQPTQTVLVCHGNAENAAQSSSWTGDLFRQELGADVFVFDYRGYGKSEGTPDEPGILADAEAALEWLCNKSGKSPDQIILVGHSIGGGPAVHLASKCGCKMLVLQRTFSSLADAAQTHYPWVPVRFLMRNQYRSSEKIKTCDQPLFQSHGDCDTVVPIELARKLYESAPSSNKKFVMVPNMGHFDVLPANYWDQLKTFVREVDADQTKQVQKSSAGF